MDNIKYPQSDIWSLGISFYNLATGGKYPFIYPKTMTQGEILSITILQEPKKLNTTNKLLNEIVNSMLIKDPFKRITSGEISDLLQFI